MLTTAVKPQHATAETAETATVETAETVTAETAPLPTTTRLSNVSIEEKERMDAAHALLGVVLAPIRTVPMCASPVGTAPVGTAPVGMTHGFVMEKGPSSSVSFMLNPENPSLVHQTKHQHCPGRVADRAATITLGPRLTRRPRSGSEGLDCLADLAAREETWLDNHKTAIPRFQRRPRSCSNPEAMRHPSTLVLPTAVLEEELAEARASCSRIPEDDGDTSETTETDDDPCELLRQARSRLLEDLSESNVNGEKGTLILPHNLSKYKKIYGSNGHIGIYTPRERAAILERFHAKRSRRNWRKKIRYNCRKSLADRRVRIKGRFVKKEIDGSCMPDATDTDAGFCPTADQPYRRLRRHTIA